MNIYKIEYNNQNIKNCKKTIDKSDRMLFNMNQKTIK